VDAETMTSGPGPVPRLPLDDTDAVLDFVLARAGVSSAQ
jgi:hypothetical protein